MIVALATVQHTGTWFVIDILKHLLKKDVLLSADILPPTYNQTIDNTLQEKYFFHTHIPSNSMTRFVFDAFVKSTKTIVTVRDPMLSLISRENRYPQGNPHMHILDGFEIMANIDLPNVFFFPIDLYTKRSEREHLLLRLADFLGNTTSDDYIANMAESWQPVNITEDATLLKCKYGEQKLELINATLFQETRRLFFTQTGMRIKNFLQKIGYNNLPWFKYIMTEQSPQQKIINVIDNHIVVAASLHALSIPIQRASDAIIRSLDNGGTIFWMGNGGSAADSQHMAAELIGRYVKERGALRSVALTTDTSILTAIGNDYGYDEVFARQLDGLCTEKDVVIAISTSGNSPNILKGVTSAKKKGAFVIGLTGRNGGNLKNVSDCVITVPSDITARVQESHLLIEHIFCELVDEHV